MLIQEIQKPQIEYNRGPVKGVIVKQTHSEVKAQNFGITCQKLTISELLL